MMQQTRSPKSKAKEQEEECKGLVVANSKDKHYYQITVRRTADTSVSWKVVHVALFALVAVFGFQACYCYGRAFSAFNFNCVLGGARLAFHNRSHDVSQDAGPGAADVGEGAGRGFKAAGATAAAAAGDSKVAELVIDYQGTRWGSPCACNFVQFMPLVQMVAAVIWGAFFVGTSHGGGGLPGDPFLHPWRIVGPLLVFCVLLLVPLLVARDYSGGGYAAFCSQFEEVLGPDLGGGDYCNVDAFTGQFGEGGQRRPFHTYMGTAVIMEKLCLCLWIGQLAVTLARILVFGDFQINRITVKTAKPEPADLV